MSLDRAQTAQGALFRLERKTRQWSALAKQNRDLQKECDDLRRSLHQRSASDLASAGHSGEDCQRDGEPGFEASSCALLPHRGSKMTNLLQNDMVEIRDIAKQQRKRARRQADFRSYAFQDKENLPVAVHIDTYDSLENQGILERDGAGAGKSPSDRRVRRPLRALDAETTE